MKSGMYLLLLIVVVFHTTACTTASVGFSLLKAQSAIESGDYDTALDNCEDALKKNNTTNPVMLFNLGEKVNVDFFSTLCLGAAYHWKDDYEKYKFYY